MSGHVLRAGECPICDASEFAALKAQYATKVAEVDRLTAALARAEAEIERLKKPASPTHVCDAFDGPCDICEKGK
jgi:hypothetical protein